MALCACVYMYSSINFDFFCQKFLCAGLWMDFLLAEIKKLKVMESAHNYEKQDTTGNRKLPH